MELDSGYTAQVKLLLPPLLRDRSEMEFPCVLYVLVSEFQTNFFFVDKLLDC